jgi:hypothetical protein
MSESVGSLPDPRPNYLPEGFVAFPDEVLEGRGAPLATGPVTPVSSPMVDVMRQYVRGAPNAEVLNHGPYVLVSISPAASSPPEWFDGLSGEPVDIAGNRGYYRESKNRKVSLITVTEDWVIEVNTAEVARADVLQIARSLDCLKS